MADEPKTGDQSCAITSTPLLAADMCHLAYAFNNARQWLMKAHFHSVRSSLHKTSVEIAATIRDLEKAEAQLREYTKTVFPPANPVVRGATESRTSPPRCSASESKGG